ncbi:MAG: hypothetical protein KF802_03655 [Bdellovibrionaceae bacterium]|nr:hypothetical protein [Pseudobdellovibrionaceae bacterium]MBX3033282.1 hypothetical protein [Pseudobdellovibrionaceae bacterium]
MTRWAKRLSVVLFLSVLVIGGQQCSNVQLEKWEEVEFLSLGKNPFRLDPPVDYPQIRRLVFFVDMSQSMISGPCIQDVDAGIGFSTTPAYTPYDPNKGLGNPNDHRASGIDCQVDPSLAIDRSSIVNTQPNLQANPPVFFKTHLGMDHEKNRLEILQKWILDARDKNPPLLVSRTKVMVVPISGGISQKKLNDKWTKLTGQPSPIRFFDLTDPSLPRVLQWLREEQDLNLGLSESDDVWRYENRTMGTSAPGSQLASLYDTIQKDMRSLNQQGLLSYTDYQVIHLGDGLLTPVQKNIEDVLKFYSTCAACAAKPETCSATCGTLVQRMNDAWGYAQDQDLSKMDFYYGLMQTLPSYFGAGYLRLDFVQLQKNRLAKAYPGEVTFFEKLRPYFNARSARLSIWQSETAETPFRLVADATKASSYKVTHMYILNSNVRVNKQNEVKVDSDGDGLFDEEEDLLGTSATNPRTNGYCLDSFMANPAFSERCAAMAKAHSCDPALDSDGDGLNECEESLLGTNPFDFDTDGDGIPDSLEWIYGYNALASDEAKDTDGDGYLNMTQFNSGLGPMQSLKTAPSSAITRYELNAQGKETISHPALGDVLVELFELIVHHVPTRQGRAVNAATLPPMYLSRVGTDAAARENNRIPYEQQLLSVVPSPDRNTVTALARMIDITNPERAYWRIYKSEIPLTNVYKQPRLDLSLFRMIRANDRNE